MQEKSALLYALLFASLLFLVLLNGGRALSALDISETNFTIYAAFAFAIVVLAMLLLYLLKDLQSHMEIIREIENIEERHHGENNLWSSQKIKLRGKVLREDGDKARRLKEIKRLVKEIKRI